MLGDMNGDGAVNTADIRPFVMALTDRPRFDLLYDVDADIAGDFDGDGRLTGNDIRFFVSALTGDLPDPKTPYNYKRFSGPVYVDGVSPDDVTQGAVGDCYFLSVLSSLAVTDPEILESMVTPLGDGTYDVRFYDRGIETYIRVDGDLPVRWDGSLVYAGDEMWVSLAEKAYAQLKGESYAELSVGNPSEAFRDVGGGWTITAWMNKPAEELYQCFRGNLAQGHSIVLRSNRNATDPIKKSHAYTVEDVKWVEGAPQLSGAKLYDVQGGTMRWVYFEDIKANFSSAVIHLT